MRELSISQANEVSGAGVIYDFALKPGVEVIGMEAVIVGYDYTTTEVRGLWETTIYETKTPIFEYYPIYAETFETITYY